MQGWIKLHRKLLNNPIFTNSEALHLWIYLLLNANHQDNEFYFNMTKVTVEKGQLITGRKKLAEATGINQSKINRILKMLKSEQLIEQQTNNRYSIITIVKWLKYQESEQLIEQQMNNKRTTDEQQMNTNKNDKKEKNEENDKNNIRRTDFLKNVYSDDILEILEEFVIERKRMGKTCTKRSIELLAPKLQKYSGGCREKAKKVINQSILSGWTGLFELREGRRDSKQKKEPEKCYE